MMFCKHKSYLIPAMANSSHNITLMTLGQRWPNVAHIEHTLVQCWTNVMRKLAIHLAYVGPTRWDNIGPMGKITLGQRHLPTLAQCN